MGISIKKTAENFEDFYRIFTEFMASHRESTHAERLGIRLEKLTFTSKNQDLILPEDRHIEENRTFKVPLVLPAEVRSGVVVLGHGLNEGDPSKILPWMYTITKTTGLPTTFFPMSFHLGRRPRSWVKKAITAYRKRMKLPGNRTSSPMNAVLSERLSNHPERFIAAGRQSRRDFVEFLKDIKSKVSGPIHFLGYSLTGFAVLSILGDESLKDIVGGSKAVIFCSGSSFLRSEPESPLILDRLAVEKLKSYIKGFQASDDPADTWFEKLIAGRNGHILKKAVERVRSRLLIVTGEKDKVTPPDAIEENLGTRSDLCLPLGIHEVPFTASESDTKDQKVLHVKLKSCYTVDPRFMDVYIRFMEAVIDFLSDKKWV